MRRKIPAMAMAALLASSPSRAFDATGADIIGLHLGMPEAEVVASLAHQGYEMTRTPDSIAAKTMDGRVLVTWSAERGVTRIHYSLWGRTSAPAKIQEAILDRFGNPDQAKPMTWCRAIGQDGLCPTDQASLTFLPESLTLLLTAGRQP